MLILTRRPTQSVHIGPDIVITILEIRGYQVRIGVNAPPHVTVLREELLEETRRGRPPDSGS